MPAPGQTPNPDAPQPPVELPVPPLSPAAAEFNEVELAELVWTIAVITAWNRWVRPPALADFVTVGDRPGWGS